MVVYLKESFARYFIGLGHIPFFQQYAQHRGRICHHCHQFATRLTIIKTSRGFCDVELNCEEHHALRTEEVLYEAQHSTVCEDCEKSDLSAKMREMKNPLTGHSEQRCLCGACYAASVGAANASWHDRDDRDMIDIDIDVD